MYQRIIVPLDGSVLAERALPHARELARMANAPLHLLRVVDVSHPAYYGPYGMTVETASFDERIATEEIASRGYLAWVEHGLVELGATVTREIRRGSVRESITGAGRPGDVIVMASHGRSGVTRWFLGSVAEDVLRHATVPVMLVHSDVEATSEATSEASATEVVVDRSRALRLLDKDRYRPEEAAYLLGISSSAICQAAFGRQLTAEIVGHDVVSIRRDDLLRWMERDATAELTPR